MLSRILMYCNFVTRVQRGFNLKHISALGSCANLQQTYLLISSPRSVHYCSTHILSPVQLLKENRSLCSAGICLSKNCFTTTTASLSGFRIRMDDEERRKKLAEIEKMRMEKKPESKIALLKYYVKRYWYIAIPVHLVSSLIWFLIAYAAVKSGLDIMGLLESIHAPEYIIEKMRSAAPNASIVVVALILYKVATPLRYATTLAGIKLTFTTLQRMGKLRTAKEVSFKMRAEYTKRSDKLKRRYSRFTKHGFRIIQKKKLNNTNGKK